MINTIIQGDCLEVMNNIPDRSIDMILCDLPYGTTDCKWDSVIPLEPLWAHYKRVIRQNGAIVLTASQPFTSALIASNSPMFRYCCIWDKKNCSGFVNASKRPLLAHEDVVVFCEGQSTYNPQMTERTADEIKRLSKESVLTIGTSVYGTKYNRSRNRNENRFKYPSTVIRINALQNQSTEKQSGRHPTQKPVALFEYLIRTYTDEGETVLDNCIGSGTTAIACINTGRSFIGIEKDPGYHRIACERVEKHREVLKSTPLQLSIEVAS